MQEIIKNNPFIRLVIPFILGVVGGFYFDTVPLNWSFYILISSLSIFVLLQLTSQKGSRLKFANYFLIISFFSLGFYQTTNINFEPVQFKRKTVVVAQLLDYPDSTEKSLKLKVKFMQQLTDSSKVNLKGKAIVYCPKSDKTTRLEPGSVLIFKAKPELISNMGNPFEFDYRAWAASNGIYYQFYANDEEWIIERKDPNFSLQFELKKLRRRLLQSYKSAGISNAELSVFTALTLGDKSMLESDLREGYAAAGLMHILAVSGLHVGIIYWVVKMLCQLLLKLKYGRFLRFMISILVLWGYATLTGLSPSVTRAATMFSVFVLGDLVGRKYAVYNSIGLAAFVLLFYNPFLIKSVGFQMSFLAVIGIVGFYPLIYKWVFVPNKWLDKIWQLIAVSIAAQLITTPLGLYYFNQFPLLFLLSNLLMIPLATGLMYLFVVLLVTIPFPFIATKIGWCISQITDLMNQFTGWVNRLDWAILRIGNLDEMQVVFLYAIIGVISYWGIRTNFRSFRMAILVIIIFIVYGSISQWNTISKSRLVVFNTYHEPIWLMSSGKEYIVGNPHRYSDIDRFIDPLVSKFNLENEVSSKLHFHDEIVFFGKDKKRGVYFNSNYFPDFGVKKCRWLIVSENTPGNLHKIISAFEPDYIIADASVPGYKLKKWQEMLKSSSYKLWSVIEKGAFFETW